MILLGHNQVKIAPQNQARFVFVIKGGVYGQNNVVWTKEHPLFEWLYEVFVVDLMCKIKWDLRNKLLSSKWPQNNCPTKGELDGHIKTYESSCMHLRGDLKEVDWHCPHTIKGSNIKDKPCELVNGYHVIISLWGDSSLKTKQQENQRKGSRRSENKAK